MKKIVASSVFLIICIFVLVGINYNINQKILNKIDEKLLDFNSSFFKISKKSQNIGIYKTNAKYLLELDKENEDLKFDINLNIKNFLYFDTFFSGDVQASFFDKKDKVEFSKILKYLNDKNLLECKFSKKNVKVLIADLNSSFLSFKNLKVNLEGNGENFSLEYTVDNGNLLPYYFKNLKSKINFKFFVDEFIKVIKNNEVKDKNSDFLYNFLKITDFITPKTNFFESQETIIDREFGKIKMNQVKIDSIYSDKKINLNTRIAKATIDENNTNKDFAKDIKLDILLYTNVNLSKLTNLDLAFKKLKGNRLEANLSFLNTHNKKIDANIEALFVSGLIKLTLNVNLKEFLLSILPDNEKNIDLANFLYENLKEEEQIKNNKYIYEF